MIEENGKRKLRTVLVGPAYPYRGGISHYNTSLARRLEGRCDVRVVNYKRLYPGFLFPGKTQYDDSRRAFDVSSDRLIDSINPFSWIRTGIFIAGLKPDVTVFQWWHPYFAPAIFKICSILRTARAGKIMMICHNVVPHEQSILDNLLSRLAFALPHGFMVQSGEDKTNLLRIRSKAKVVSHPLPLFDFFKAGELSREDARKALGEKEGPLILFFGYIRRYKGLRHLIEAMPRIRDATGARLLVVGEFYEDEAPYRDLVSSLGLSGYVSFIDRYVGNEEVAGFFCASDLVVLPYISATQSGIAQIALSFDRPVVVTAVGGLPEVVREGRTGFIVPPGDPEALAGAVERFFREGWAERMAPFFTGEKTRFTWPVLVEKFLSLAGEL